MRLAGIGLNIVSKSGRPGGRRYTMLIIIIIVIVIIIMVIIIIMPKIQFLLDIHKKDILLLPTPTEVAFNTTNSPRFYSSPIHLSPIILVF